MAATLPANLLAVLGLLLGCPARPIPPGPHALHRGRRAPAVDVSRSRSRRRTEPYGSRGRWACDPGGGMDGLPARPENGPGSTLRTE